MSNFKTQVVAVAIEPHPNAERLWNAATTSSDAFS